jgi:hypothetical protein
MGHTPFGYRIEGGKAVIDEVAAGQIRKLYENYLSGLSLENAAKEAGINTYHGTVKKLLRNRHYLGDAFYPAIIDENTFTKAALEGDRRSEKLGRNNRVPAPKVKKAPTRFTFIESIAIQGVTPVEQAEYLYSLIESEVR